jgi:hypothetical protein
VERSLLPRRITPWIVPNDVKELPLAAAAGRAEPVAP